MQDKKNKLIKILIFFWFLLTIILTFEVFSLSSDVAFMQSKEIIEPQIEDTLEPDNLPTKVLSPSKIYEENKKSVVVVKNTSQGLCGTGFIVDKDKGYILTNSHMVASNTKKVSAVLYDGQNISCTIINIDKTNDTCVLKTEDIKYLQNEIKIFNNVRADIGEDIYAIGNPLGPLNYSFVKGMISHNSRRIKVRESAKNMALAYQADMVLTNGYSGSPVFNNKGVLIGIICAKYNKAANLGIIIPSNSLKSIMDIVGKTDKVEIEQLDAEYKFGISVKEKKNQLIIQKVASKSDAFNAGLKKDDILIIAGNITNPSKEELKEYIKDQFTRGTDMVITVMRDNNPLIINFAISNTVINTDKDII